MRFKFDLKTDEFDLRFEFEGWGIKPNQAFHEIFDRLKQEGIIKS